jgi:ubiquinone/menaquinone biosynthesis C-methylase UbiE
MPHKFDPKNIKKLDNPERTQWQSVEAFLETLRPRTGMAYADIGCGAGYFTLPVAKHVGTEGVIYAVDLQPEMLQELERRVKAIGLTNVITVPSSEREIPLPSSCVDAACLADVFHELEEPVSFLQEIRRILRPGGRLIVIDWKPIETPVGPPLSERVPLQTLLATLQEAEFQYQQEHPIYPYHHVVEAK